MVSSSVHAGLAAYKLNDYKLLLFPFSVMESMRNDFFYPRKSDASNAITEHVTKN